MTIHVAGLQAVVVVVVVAAVLFAHQHSKPKDRPHQQQQASTSEVGSGLNLVGAGNGLVGKGLLMAREMVDFQTRLVGKRPSHGKPKGLMSAAGMEVLLLQVQADEWLVERHSD